MSWAGLPKIAKTARPSAMVRHYVKRTHGLRARLRDVITRHGSVTAMATVIGRTEGALRKWLRGESEPSATDLRLLSTATGVSVDWMLFGIANEFSTAQTLRYLAFALHRREEEMFHKNGVRWDLLGAEDKRALQQRARTELIAWLVADSGRNLK